MNLTSFPSLLLQSFVKTLRFISFTTSFYVELHIKAVYLKNNFYRRRFVVWLRPGEDLALKSPLDSKPLMGDPAPLSSVLNELCRSDPDHKTGPTRIIHKLNDNCRTTSKEPTPYNIHQPDTCNRALPVIPG